MTSFSTRNVSSRMQKNQHSWNKIRLFAIIWVCLIALFYSVWSVGNANITNKKYTIEKGYTITVLNDKLGFGVASWRYRLWLKFFAPQNIIVNVGTYETTSNITIETFLTKTLTKPLYVDQTITILPGWNIYDIDAYIASKWIGWVWELLDTARINFWKYQTDFPFLKNASSLEWFLYPDTYRLRQEAWVDDAIRVMLREFDKKIWKSYLSLDSKKAYETLILASIVEREERNSVNQPIVAGILSKRFKEGIALWADATVCYGYAKTQKQCTPSFIGSVIRDDNPYNTRSKRGYTPTPISNVPLSSWNASINPETSPYYYYLHGSDGQIHYGRTNEEHVINKQKYLN